jgi:hypothetical protein
MTIAPLRDALSTLRAAFRRPDVLGVGEDLTIDLPLAAGLRFELWLTANAPAGMAMDANWMKTTGVAGSWTREVTIDGARIRWPLQSESGQDNTVRPRPMARLPNPEDQDHGKTVPARWP